MTSMPNPISATIVPRNKFIHPTMSALLKVMKSLPPHLIPQHPLHLLLSLKYLRRLPHSRSTLTPRRRRPCQQTTEMRSNPPFRTPILRTLICNMLWMTSLSQMLHPPIAAAQREFRMPRMPRQQELLRRWIGYRKRWLRVKRGWKK